jgi:hypothetical protein
MPLYEREISIVPEYYVDIEYNNQIKRIEVISESTRGGRLQLKRKLFASCVFINNLSTPFLRQMPYIKDDNEYLFYRFLSFRRHLQEMKNLIVLDNKTPKILKRLAQTTDMIAPVLDDKLYNEIMTFVAVNLDNRDIQLLNEYANICGNIASIMDSPELLYRMICDGKIEDMYNVLTNSTDELYMRKNLDKKSIDKLVEFKDIYIKKILSLKSANEIQKYKTEVFDNAYTDAHGVWESAMYSQYKNPEKIKEYAKSFDNIFMIAGIHPIEIYWMNYNTVGILEDDFTKNITDIDYFVKENGLLKMDYKIIKPSEISEGVLSSTIYVKYKQTEQELKNYEVIKNKLLADKKNFKIKKKFVWIRK